MADVEMKRAEDKNAEVKKEEKKEEEQKPIPISPEAEIRSNAALIDRAVSTLEPRFSHRVLRTLTALRKRIDASILWTAIEGIYCKGSSLYRRLKRFSFTGVSRRQCGKASLALVVTPCQGK